MSNLKFKSVFVLLILFSSICTINAQSGRTVTDLSGNDWKLWLDTDAKWQNDALYLPGTDLKTIPVNLPTGGWEALQNAPGKTVHLPATVEQFHWGQNGNAFGVSGNYLGVSWFTAKVNVPASMKGKRIVLDFESVRFRAEVFVNKKLVGYDLINSTPFEIDITKAVVPGSDNEIAVRITDPNGNFDWRDSQNFMWGEYRTQPSHGFGGITGKVKLVATDAVFISDVFVKNKPQVNEIDAQLSFQNNSGKPAKGTLEVQVKEFKSGKIVWQKEFSGETLKPSENTRTLTVTLDDANLWSVDNPFLYTITATWKGTDKTSDIAEKRFGFRWFEVKDVSGDKQFYLNGKRIVLRTSISWGFWPVNGIMPSDELARKQVQDAKTLGLNMLNFHRTIGQTNVLDYADELGLLYFEEPGGNQYPENLFNPKNDHDKKLTTFYFGVRNEKLFRMIKRDRSHPSLIIYNMHNERGAQPQQQDRDEMTAGHKLDETRIMTYNSSNGPIKQNDPDPRFKLHLSPYDFKFYDYGWFDQHHAGGPGVYHDNLYNNPKDYAKYTDHKDEIIYYGEEGAIGTPPRLQLIRDEILKTGKDIGWETDTYLKWYDAYDQFLKNNGFSKAFPNVDSLTRKMGNVAYYYQGRVIENVRINNTIDGYAVNGWESMKLENHSGIVDNYRNLKGDTSLIARYNQPLFVAVKLNHKVLQTGDTTTIDLFIVNEKDVKGNCTLEVQAINEKGENIWHQESPVTITGGVQYGELLLSGLKFVAQQAGYTKIKASLKKGGTEIARGADDLFAVRLNTSGISPNLQVADTNGTIAPFLKSIGINTLKAYRSGYPEGHVLLVGGYSPPQVGNPLVVDLLEWVNNGNKLVVIGNTDKWAAFLAKKEIADYRGAQVLGTSWYGGNFFVKEHPLFEGLPQACVFNWEYQCFAAYNKSRSGLRMFNGETVVGCVSDHKQEVYSALSIIPHGRGKIILCTLDLLSCIKDIKDEKRAEGDGENAAMNSFNASQKNPANIVGQQLLLNLLK
ncbi:MAG: glycoside hydrolase family 2 TIM barrel-domain containing protein [Bacteroidota bacterium]|nr:glycoside hydrolase family 2 TIM barrel-domain containing protein [Bacteroidota bacterium]